MTSWGPHGAEGAARRTVREFCCGFGLVSFRFVWVGFVYSWMAWPGLAGAGESGWDEGWMDGWPVVRRGAEYSGAEIRD